MSKKELNNKKIRFTDQVVLVESIKESDVDNVKKLLRRKSACIDISEINNSGLTALHHAVLENSIELVKLMLENKADVNCLDEDDWTPLHLAASMGYHEVSKLLLQYGADPNALTQENQKPIDLLDSDNLDLINLFHQYDQELKNFNQISQKHQQQQQQQQQHQHLSIC